MDMTNEELNFIADLFQVTAPSKLQDNHTLTLQSAVPANIAELLNNTKLTLLAEVIDTRGIKRCWRGDNLNIQSQGFEVESISSTGLFLKSTTQKAPLAVDQQIKLTLIREILLSTSSRCVLVSEAWPPRSLKFIKGKNILGPIYSKPISANMPIYMSPDNRYIKLNIDNSPLCVSRS
ncbi:MAG: hypothetical protein ACTH5C_02375 [Pseudoalteromonas prydzensis]|uniref:hypothetical protein n=1 Tax=Pseudoalteromonas prydzensis TaxID=182141 RepID=UPI003F987283